MRKSFATLRKSYLTLIKNEIPHDLYYFVSQLNKKQIKQEGSYYDTFIKIIWSDSSYFI